MRARVVFLFWLVAAVAAAANAAPADTEGAFVWNEARSRMASARTEEDFRQAAGKYNELARMGARSGPLFYNLGTALLLAGRHADAYAALARAERYLGTTFEIRRNMLLAVAGIEGTEDPALPWYRVPLFWHFRLPMAARRTVAIVLFNVLWLAVALRSAGLRRVAEPVFWAAIVLFVFFASSVAASVHAERKADAAAAIPTRFTPVAPAATQEESS